MLLMFAALLTMQLGHEDFAVREAASTALENLGPLALPALERACLSDDPEIVVRAKRLRKKLWLETIERYGRMPWVDCLPESISELMPEECRVDRYSLISYHLAHANRVPPGDDWPQYREATRLLCLSLIHSDVTLERVMLLVVEMNKKEKTWDGKQYRIESELILVPPKER